MAEAERAGGVAGDLEKELTCSICTDVLFQPLTLLDCLHTFCGACLKEWFAFQAQTAASIHPYTCPSCRASVRSTQPNATVTTLLDIFLKANPARGKSESDKQADRARYRPGDNVLPKLRRRDERDDADQRLLADVQQLSLREVGIPSGNSSTLELPRERASRDGSRESRRSRRSNSRTAPGPSPSRAAPPRAVEHQSSLRSLLSASDVDAEEMDEGLVRQVLEELVAEGVDLNQIGVAEEEVITERIAEAVRRRQAERHAERQRERRERRDRITASSSSSPAPLRGPRRATESGTSTPPVSRPGLIDAANRVPRPRHQRAASTADAADTETLTAPAPQRRQSDTQQRSRLEARQHFRESVQAAFQLANSNPASRPVSRPVSRPTSTYPEPYVSCRQCGRDDVQYELHYHCDRCDDGTYNICLSCYRHAKGCKHWFGFGRAAWPLYERQAPEGGYPPEHETPHILVGRRYRRPQNLPAESIPSPTFLADDDPQQRLETGIFCDICKAFADACYWKCDSCNEGDWGFCNDCVNQGRHCTHPLLPVARKESAETPPVPEATPSAPSTPRLDGGLAPPDHDVIPTTPPLTPKSASLIRGPAHVTIASSIYRPLTFTTLCNICRYPIPPSHARYHCLKCNAGDYDICTSCYHKVNVSNRISKEDGPNGWRKCVRGHRMVVVGFEDRDDGQRRIVVRDLVGGYALKEKTNNNADDAARDVLPQLTDGKWKWSDSDGKKHYRDPTIAAPSSQRFPPDGGVGLRLQATWRWWPEDGVKDELAFPRGAEIREAADINGDWYWGVYCGANGLFPANHAVAL